VALCHVEEEYEHLDFIWADSALTNIFPKLSHLISKHSNNHCNDDNDEREENKED